jgi:hypothetical protein
MPSASCCSSERQRQRKGKDLLRKRRPHLLLIVLLFWVFAFVHPAATDQQGTNQEQPAPPVPADFQTLLLGPGLAILDPERGSVFFCTNLFLPGFPPIPQGQCTKMGSVGTSSLGFMLIGSGEVDFFIINKTTEHIFQCVTTPSQYGGAPDGVCKQTGNMRAL